MSTPLMKLFDLTGQVALVTGGSRGLGLQMAQALGQAGARVMLTARKAQELDAAEMESTPNLKRRFVRSLKSFEKLASGLSTVTPRVSWKAWNSTSSWFCAQL